MPETNTDNDTAQPQSNNEDDYPSLEDLVRGYLDARGINNVAHVAVGKEGFKRGSLVITASTGMDDDLPTIVAETDVVTHHGYQYELLFEEYSFGPRTLNCIPLFISDTNIGMDSVPLEDGLTAADDYMQDLIDDGEAPRNPTLAE